MAQPPAVAIVGAGPGLGSALARRFAEAGWSIALVAKRRDALDACLAELGGFGVNRCAAEADVVDRPALERAFASMVTTSPPRPSSSRWNDTRLFDWMFRILPARGWLWM